MIGGTDRSGFWRISFPMLYFLPGYVMMERMPAPGKRRRERNSDMEIERKWMVDGWPEKNLPLLFEHSMRQGYLCVDPTVRIREEARKGGETEYILCFKSGRGLVRKEIEMPLSRDQFLQLEDLTGYPLIPKIRRTYQLPDGLRLEVNHVDQGLPTEFWYAEVEYGTVEQAEGWNPETDGLGDYLSCEVTGQPGQSMGAYWVQTRLSGGCAEKSR